MSKFQIADEAVLSMWDSLALELAAIAPTDAAADAFLEAAGQEFLSMLIDLD